MKALKVIVTLFAFAYTIIAMYFALWCKQIDLSVFFLLVVVVLLMALSSIRATKQQ